VLLAANAAQAVDKQAEQAEQAASKPSAPAPSPVTGSTAAEARIRGHAAESETVAQAPLLEKAASRASHLSGPVPSSVLVIDTLELLRGFERAGFSAQQAEAITRATLAVTKSSVEPLATRADLERHILGQLSELREFKQDIGSRHREAAANSKHMADMVLAECEKLRAELRYTHEKVSSSQKLDLNLERGRIRDDLTAQDGKMAQSEARLDREMAAMRTTIEAAKNDVIKYAVGTIMSFGALSLGLMRLLG
jgi:predicted RNase H-like nuclease